MRLEGSCHCRAVTFTVEAPSPVPYQRCYCTICRKTAGAGGFAINIGALAETLELAGGEAVGRYHARMAEGGESEAARSFCTRCGSALWLWDPRWPGLLHPHASAIDTPLPVPPERVHILLGSRASWAVPDIAPGDRAHDDCPMESLAVWHARHRLEG
jgi:hypothetical protein